MDSELLWSELALVESLPQDFVQGFAHNFHFAWIVFGFSWMVSPLVWGKVAPEKKILWHTTFASMLQPIYVFDSSI